MPNNRLQKIYGQYVQQLTADKQFMALPNSGRQLLVEKIIVDGWELINARYKDNIQEVCDKMLIKYIGQKATSLKITDNGMEF
jgi:hypothetical protein